MKENSIYSDLQQKMTLLILLVSIAPLFAMGATLYYQFSQVSVEKTREQIRYRAQAQAEAVDLFLKERTAILAAMADTHTFHELIDENNLDHIFSIMNKRAGAFVDLGVIDFEGNHRAYVGPYNLKGKNYYQQKWFGETISKGIYKSDVFTGFRLIPHFVIAVCRHENNTSWILRATVDSEVLGRIVRSAQIGKTGDAFIINRDGIYQTPTRFMGRILSESGLDTKLFGSRISLVEVKQTGEPAYLLAGSWLNDDKWLLVIKQQPSELMRQLFVARNAGIVIICVGVLIIIITTVFTTRQAVSRLKRSEKRMNRLNAQLVQSDKLAALGKLAAGVAHEINNPLAVILQKTGWMEDLLEEEEFQQSLNIDEFKKSVAKIEEHVERARKVVHNMLGYSRKMEPRLEDVDVNDVINQTISILDNYSRDNKIVISTDFSDELPIIGSDQSQLQQVFLNLISNAIDATGKDGKIEITTRKKGPDIQVRVSDNGPGIPDDEKNKIFDPFFTTKAKDKGTGLGLWVVYDIIKKMGGSIEIISQKGEGATFDVRIPIVTPDTK